MGLSPENPERNNQDEKDSSTPRPKPVDLTQLSVKDGIIVGRLLADAAEQLSDPETLRKLQDLEEPKD